MQRRAAAAYAALFIFLAVGAYVMIGFSEAPEVSIENPDITAGEGETIAVDGRDYTVGTEDDLIVDASSASERETTLLWVNASEHQTIELENDTDVPATAVTWSGQSAPSTVTVQNGSKMRYNGSDYTVSVVDATLHLTSSAGNLSFSIGDTIEYSGNATLLVEAGDGSATIAWGEPYRVLTQTDSVDSFDFHQQFNVTKRLAADPAVDDEPVTRADGREYVVYQNGTVQALDAYLPVAEVQTFEEGDQFEFDTDGDDVRDTAVTVANVTAERVLIEWRGPVEHEVSVGHGENVTLGPGDRLFVAEFPDNETIQLTSDVAAYQERQALHTHYWERIDGLWGIVILGTLAAVFLLGLAYLPSRY